jgi:hypothetical protein
MGEGLIKSFVMRIFILVFIGLGGGLVKKRVKRSLTRI